MTVQPRGGRGKCTICDSASRGAIDVALVSGALSLAKIAAEYGVNESSLKRHRRNHPSIGVTKLGSGDAPEILPSAAAVDVPAQLLAQFNRTENGVKLAEGSGSLNAIQGAHREHRLTIDAIARWNAEQAKIAALNAPKEVINILMTEAWLQVRRVIVGAVERFPEARLTIADALTKLEDPTYIAPSRLWGADGYRPPTKTKETIHEVRSPLGQRPPGGPQRPAKAREADEGHPRSRQVHVE